MGFLPFTCRIFIGFRKCGINMDRPQDLVQTQSVFHGKDILGNNVTGVGTATRIPVIARAARAVDPVMAWSSSSHGLEIHTGVGVVLKVSATIHEAVEETTTRSVLSAVAG